MHSVVLSQCRELRIDTRQVRDWVIVLQLVFIQSRFLKEWRYCRFFKNGMESTTRTERLTMLVIIGMRTEALF